MIVIYIAFIFTPGAPLHDDLNWFCSHSRNQHVRLLSAHWYFSFPPVWHPQLASLSQTNLHSSVSNLCKVCWERHCGEMLSLTVTWNKDYLAEILWGALSCLETEFELLDWWQGCTTTQTPKYSCAMQSNIPVNKGIQVKTRAAQFYH